MQIRVSERLRGFDGRIVRRRGAGLALFLPPAMSSTDMKMAVKMTAMGLLTASSATGMPLKPSAGSVWYVLQKNSVLPDR